MEREPENPPAVPVAYDLARARREVRGAVPDEHPRAADRPETDRVAFARTQDQVRGKVLGEPRGWLDHGRSAATSPVEHEDVAVAMCGERHVGIDDEHGMGAGASEEDGEEDGERAHVPGAFCQGTSGGANRST